MTLPTRIRNLQMAVLMLFCIPVLTDAQPVPQSSPELLIASSDHHFMNPQFSPDGSRIAFTEAQYRGLWLADADGREATRITAGEGAGFRFSWSHDGSHIAANEYRYAGRSREYALKVFDVHTAQERLIADYARRVPPMPVFTASDAGLIYRDGSGLATIESGISRTVGNNGDGDGDRDRIGPGDDTAAGNARAVAVPVRDVIRIFHADGTERELRPLPGEEFLDAVVSPDGQRIAYRVYGGSLWVAGLDGRNAIELGRGETPVWSPDSRMISFMLTEDDGHDVTGSDIYIADAAGAWMVNITEASGLIAMHPTWSPDGTRIAFGDMNSGAIYQVRLGSE
jgi:dipeptidyl aminopeptidase/acylaminoacyl peptidase